MSRINQVIGLNLRAIRRREGLRQEDVANHLNIQRSAINKIERGSQKLSAENLVKICSLLNCTSEEILF